MSQELHAELAQVAQQLIALHGRDVTFRRFNQSAADPAKPWRGPTNLDASPAAQEILKAVAVPASSATELGMSVQDQEMLHRVEKVYIVAVGQQDLSLMDEVVDTNVNYRIEFVEVLEPGAVRIVHFVGVRR
jgi:hypothetical protein